MSVVMFMEIPGATTEQYDAINKIMGINGPQDEPAGLLSHVCAKTDDGLHDVRWDSGFSPYLNRPSRFRRRHLNHRHYRRRRPAVPDQRLRRCLVQLPRR
jgi:hypothetical protein